MEIQNILYGNVDELRQVKSALELQSVLRQQIGERLQEKQGLEKSIEAEERLLSKNIEDTISGRRKDIADKFDGEIKKVQDRIKGVRGDRKRAKNKGIAERIKTETAELVQENKNLKDEIKTIFKQKGVSLMWNIEPVYMLYYPRTLPERLVLLAVAIMTMLIIPSFAVGMSEAHWFFKIFEYIIIVVVFLALYLVGYSFAKVRKGDAFDDSYGQRKKLLDNQSEIRRIKRTIKRDKSEEKYNLGSYDSDIAELEANLSDIVQRKNEAISDFEQNTKIEIEQEITERDKGKIDEMKEKLSALNSTIKELEEKQKNVTIEISTKYTAYLGEENMNTETIDKMIILLSENQISAEGEVHLQSQPTNINTIGEALNYIKK